MPHPFRLQSLLNDRQQREDTQVFALSEAKSDERRVREAIASLGEHREDQTVALAALVASGVFDAEEYMRHAVYLDAVGRALDQQFNALDAVTTRVDERRAALVEALKERRVLERLRDRHAEEAALEDNRRETRELDDMVMGRYRRVP